MVEHADGEGAARHRDDGGAQRVREGREQPGRILEQRVLEAAYTFHNYGRSTIGNRSDIEHVPIERLAAFYQKYYQPDNAVLTVAGKFDEPKTLALVAEMFGKIPRPHAQARPDLHRGADAGWRAHRDPAARRRQPGDHGGLPRARPARTRTRAALDVLAAVLGASPSGRLYKALVDNKKAVVAGMDFEELHDPGYHPGGGAAAPGPVARRGARRSC